MNTILKYLCLLSIFLVFCTNREQKNPLDPQNPDTGGKPVGLKIYSEYDKITLSWRAVDVNGLVGYNVYRKISSDTGFTLIHLTPAGSTEFYDCNATYDLKYTYIISALTSSYESLKSDSVSITPGATIIWATDVDNRRIIKITHDGIHEISRMSVDGYPWDIAINHRDGSYWFSDILWGEINYIINNKLKRYTSPTEWWKPVDIELDVEREILWVADEQGKIIRISPAVGDSLQEISCQNFISPYSVSVVKQSGKCWVADPMSKNVFTISHDGKIISISPVQFVRPCAVVVNQSDGNCWVADSTSIIKLSSDGYLSFSITADFQYAYTLDINKNTGELWVVDLGLELNGSRVLKFDEQGNKLLEVSGFNYSRKIAVNLCDNGCVVVDTGNGRIVRLSSLGEILGEIGGYYYPRGLAIEYDENW